MEDLQQELNRLREENAKLKGGNKPISMKVGAKGGASLYGLGRFPVTLYKEQWERLLGAADQIREFLVQNADNLKVKD